MSRTRQPSTRRIGAAERAITVLDTLAEGGELGTNEIARRTGMTPSTVSRQLGTLAGTGLVERVASSGRYRLGIRLVHLANAVGVRLIDLYLRIEHRLSNRADAIIVFIGRCCSAAGFG